MPAFDDYHRITATIRDLLHWLPSQQRIQYKMCVLVYMCLLYDRNSFNFYRAACNADAV